MLQAAAEVVAKTRTTQFIASPPMVFVSHTAERSPGQK
jgi:hypothetical protein